MTPGIRPYVIPELFSINDGMHWGFEDMVQTPPATNLSSLSLNCFSFHPQDFLAFGLCARSVRHALAHCVSRRRVQRVRTGVGMMLPLSVATGLVALLTTSPVAARRKR